MIFEIHAERNAQDQKIFYYDNIANILKDADGNVFEFPNRVEHNQTPYTSFDRDNPIGKSRLITLLKIQLGLSCNYTCDYCSQKFVERAPETNKKDIDAFMDKLSVLEFNEQQGLKIEFWGGEPLVYWKTLKPLTEAIAEKFASWKRKPRFSIITNGSILNEEIIDWLMMMQFEVAISHDGPGQHVRGPDPFDDPEQREIILGFYRQMSRLKKPFSFNTMMNSQNRSRRAVYDWFVNLTGDPNIQIGEGTMVDAYDEDGIVHSLITKADHFDYRQKSFADMFVTNGQIGFGNIQNKIGAFIQGLLNHDSADYLGQKCGMEDLHTIAIDLRGNVITCQNVSSVETSKNGESHLIGTLDDYDNVCLKTSTHWSKRKECPECPVLHLCKGACMFLDNKFWDISCANAYSDNVPLFALAITQVTNGYIPTLIKSDTLPEDRQDIFGTIFEHKEDPARKIIPIKVVHEVVGEIEGVEVYGKSRVESA